MADQASRLRRPPPAWVEKSSMASSGSTRYPPVSTSTAQRTSRTGRRRPQRSRTPSLRSVGPSGIATVCRRVT